VATDADNVTNGMALWSFCILPASSSIAFFRPDAIPAKRFHSFSVPSYVHSLWFFGIDRREASMAVSLKSKVIHADKGLSAMNLLQYPPT